MKGQQIPLDRRGRPGQRQQERLQRLARRRRRQRIIITSIVAVLVVALASMGIWQYQRYTADQAAANNAHATATAKAKEANANATADAIAKAIGTPTPPADTPPTLSQTPVKLSDGLQYIDVKEGIGDAAKKGGTVTVYYTGWLQDSGKKFDSSYDDGGQAFPVPVGQGQVIKGWDEGLIGVRAGGVRRLIIPADLAYGAQGASQGKVPIPPNATLVFDVTVIGVK